MKKRFSNLSNAKPKTIELKYHRMKPEDFDDFRLEAILRRRFLPAQQRLLDKLLDANGERILTSREQRQLDELIAEYGEDLVEKARAYFLLRRKRQ
ncbi:MAG: hypothetical protein ACREEM_19155 [Blastocatellia bacterium]